MIDKLAYATVYVLDQDSALSFYTEKLDFEVREDITLGDFRWLTVGPKTQSDVSIVLMAAKAGPNMSEDQAAKLRELVKSGALGGGVLATDDCQADYEALKAKGVEFAGPPEERPYGLEAMLRDDSGNFFSLTQRR